MALSPVSPVINRGVVSNWLQDLPASTEMLTVDTSGNVSHQSIPVASFAALTGAPGDNAALAAALNGKLSLTGGTVTGQLVNALGTITASTPLSLTQTWNNAGVTFNSFLLNVTDSASASGSLLMDLQVGGSSKFSVDKRGMITTATGTVPSAGGIGTGKLCLQLIYDNYGIGVNGNGRPVVVVNSSQEQTLGLNTIVGSAGLYGWSTGTQANQSATYDLALFRDAANTLAQRNSTNAQTFRLANTWTSSTSFENLQLQWASNEARIGSSVGSAGGTQRNLVLGSWNSAGTFTPCLTVGTTGTATFSAGVFAVAHVINQNIDMRSDTTDGVLLIQGYDTSGFNRLQLGGTTSSFPAIKRNAAAINFRLADDSAACAITASEVSGSGWGVKSAAGMLQLNDGSGSVYAYFGSSTTQLNGQGIFLDTTSTAHTWTNSGTRAMVHSPNSNVFEIRNSTSAQTFRLANTWTSATSFENLQLQWSSNEARIGTSVGSAGGTQRSLVLGAWNSAGTWSPGITITSSGVTIRSLVDNTTIPIIVNNAYSLGVTVQSYRLTPNDPNYTLGSNNSAFAGIYLGIGSGTNCGYLKGATDGVVVRNRLDSANGRLTAGAATFSGDVTVSAVNLITDTTTGTKIGTGATQKIGFFNATPVVQPAAVADATDAASVITQLNSLLARMRDLGLIAT